MNMLDWWKSPTKPALDDTELRTNIVKKLEGYVPDEVPTPAVFPTLPVVEQSRKPDVWSLKYETDTSCAMADRMLTAELSEATLVDD